MPHRCAFGCNNITDVPLHIFPNPDKFPDRFQLWVSLVGGKLESTSDYEFYKKKRICDIHFTIEHKNRFKRLNALAVPTLNLPSNSTNSGRNATVQALDTTREAELATATQLLVSSTPGNYGNVTARRDIFAEHNYSAINRGRPRKSDKVAAGRSFAIRPLSRKIRSLQSEIGRLRKRGQTLKERVVSAEKLSKAVVFQQIVQNMTKPAQLFLHMQQQTDKHPKGRRFTTEEKILCLSLYKKSPKSYRLLYKYFTLPSSKAMKRLLGSIKLTPGINEIIFNKIKKTMHNKEASDRLCSLIFDEMSITPQVFYSAQKDQLEGFTTKSKSTFADHVLVFMVKGVKNSFKQPVAYFFTNSLTKLELKLMLKSVIEHCLQSGLIIINTVCDQSPINVGAITEMVEETKAMYLRQGKEFRNSIMRIKAHNIVPLYDTPHLFKGLRNNLITKNLKYRSNDEEKTIKWDYYQMVYNADKSYGELRLLHKITEEHVNPDIINKMRVKSATQLFSHSVAVVTEHLTARGDLPAECRQLVDLTLMLDNLFDSLNVSSFSIPNGKIFKGPVKRNSPHHELWKKAKVILKTVKYIKPVKVGDKIRLVETVVPSVTNLIKTIEGMEKLWEVLSRKYGLDVMLTRNFNQDPLENFFGNIRSYGARNVAPNTVGFEGAFKALLLNNFSSNHSERSNCEEDFNVCLQSLEFFLTEENMTPTVSEATNTNFNYEICFAQRHDNDAGQSNYVCGWVLKKCLVNIVKGCKDCKSSVLGNPSNKNNYYITAKEYRRQKWLCYPSEVIENYFRDLQNMVESFLKKNVPKWSLKSNILAVTDLLLDNPFKCPVHKDILNKYFKDKTINIIIYSWCRTINRILSGKIQFTGDDETKIAAFKYFTKRKHYKNRK